MAKTDFSTGTIVTPEFLDSIYFTGGGHKHDGLDNDGSVPKISRTEIATNLVNCFDTVGLNVEVHDSLQDIKITKGSTVCYNSAKTDYKIVSYNSPSTLHGITTIPDSNHWLYLDEGGCVCRFTESTDTNFTQRELFIYIGLDANDVVTIVAASSEIVAGFDLVYLRQIGCIFIRHIGATPHYINSYKITEGVYYFDELYDYAQYLTGVEDDYSSGATTISTLICSSRYDRYFPIFGTATVIINDTGTLPVITVKRDNIPIKRIPAKELLADSFPLHDIGYSIQVDIAKDYYFGFVVEGFRKFWK